MPDYLDNRSGRSTFAEKMKEKRNFKDITRQIKEELPKAIFTLVFMGAKIRKCYL